jgi:2-polyprenyl-3-methyl-5-hydroxy-6-metoxy-1,4-benzoquinol methylase
MSKRDGRWTRPAVVAPEHAGSRENPTSPRIESVKAFFAHPHHYLLPRHFNIQLRTTIVQEFVGDRPARSILDIGCGNGAISLPLLGPHTRLTLVDVSPEMLARAQARIPQGLGKQVELLNADFLSLALPEHAYDLILCLGVLAHVASPEAVMSKMASLLAPQGSLIVQNTNEQHPITYVKHVYACLRKRLLPAQQRTQRAYPLNQLSEAALIEHVQQQGLVLAGTYRYNMPFPGMGRVMSNEDRYRFIRKVYGTTARNTCGWLGSECIYHFQYPGDDQR